MSVNAKTTEQIVRIYDDPAPNWWRYGIGNTVLAINRYRSMFSEATGDVLDVACGTWENFKYLKGAQTVTAVDLSPAMVALAQKRGSGFAVAMGDAQHMTFEDDTFDTIVSALSSCTFPDHVAAFLEMQRVVKPGGTVLLLEHGRSSVAWIARKQDRTGAAKTMEHGGCRSNREISDEPADAGLNVVSHKRTHLGMIHRIMIRV